MQMRDNGKTLKVGCQKEGEKKKEEEQLPVVKENVLRKWGLKAYFKPPSC